MLRTDELIDEIHVMSTSDRDRPPVCPTPPDVQQITGRGEDGADVVRVVGEELSRIRLAIHAVLDPRTIRVHEPSKQLSRMTDHQAPLPRRQADRSLVLRPPPVLREHARPVVPVGVHLHAPNLGDVTRELWKPPNRRYGLAALLDQMRIAQRTRDPELVDAAGLP
jgi:hypothetical protein